MTAAAVDRRPRLPRRGDNLPSSFGLALAMHALLFGGMTLAVQWRTQPAAPAVAELWSSLPPLPVAPPEPIVAPPPPPPPPKPAPEPEREADIALKVEKKPPPKIEPPKEEKKVEPKKPEPKKEEPKKEAPKKEEKKVEAKKVEPKVEEPERPRTDLERLMAQAQAAATAPPGGTPAASGVVSGVRGSDAGYSALVVGCVRPHIVFVVPEGTGANVYAQFAVELLPDGSVGNVRLVRPSGLAGYDAAAERAIRRCDPFPRNREGKVERNLTLTLRPVETR
jgi:colicin import membrane protein